MRKIDYILLKIQKRNEVKKKKSDYWDYFNRRIDHRDVRPPMHVCRDCHFTAKRYLTKCPNCGGTENIYNVGFCAKPPKKNASKKKWKEFWDRHGLKKDNIWQ